MPSKSSAVSGDATTTICSAPASRPAAITQSTIRRPSSGCRCFGVADRIRVPRPPAMTTAASGELIRSEMAGAPVFEPGIAGPKPAALPLGYAPGIQNFSLSAVGENQDQRDDRQDRGECEHEETDDVREQDGHDGERLRGGSDPSDLPDRVTALVSPQEVERDEHQRQQDDRPARDVVRERRDDRLEDRDPQRDAQTPRAEPAARATAVVFERVARLRGTVERDAGGLRARTRQQSRGPLAWR